MAESVAELVRNVQPPRQDGAAATVQEWQMENARRDLSKLPRYDGNSPFRTWIIEYDVWAQIHQINEIPYQNFIKTTILAAFSGKAAKLTKCLGTATERFQE